MQHVKALSPQARWLLRLQYGGYIKALTAELWDVARLEVLWTISS